MADQQATELSQPYIGALDLPAAFVTAQFPAIFVLFSLVVFPVRRDQLDAALLPSLTQRVGVITTIRYDSFRFLPRPSFRPGDADLGECGVRKRNFCRRGTFQPNSQRNTFTVSQYRGP